MKKFMIMMCAALCCSLHITAQKGDSVKILRDKTKIEVGGKTIKINKEGIFDIKCAQEALWFSKIEREEPFQPAKHLEVKRNDKKVSKGKVISANKGFDWISEHQLDSIQKKNPEWTPEQCQKAATGHWFTVVHKEPTLIVGGEDTVCLRLVQPKQPELMLIDENTILIKKDTIKKGENGKFDISGLVTEKSLGIITIGTKLKFGDISDLIISVVDNDSIVTKSARPEDTVFSADELDSNAKNLFVIDGKHNINIQWNNKQWYLSSFDNGGGSAWGYIIALILLFILLCISLWFYYQKKNESQNTRLELEEFDGWVKNALKEELEKVNSEKEEEAEDEKNTEDGENPKEPAENEQNEKAEDALLTEEQITKAVQCLRDDLKAETEKLNQKDELIGRVGRILVLPELTEENVNEYVQKKQDEKKDKDDKIKNLKSILENVCKELGIELKRLVYDNGDFNEKLLLTAIESSVKDASDKASNAAVEKWRQDSDKNKRGLNVILKYPEANERKTVDEFKRDILKDFVGEIADSLGIEKIRVNNQSPLSPYKDRVVEAFKNLFNKKPEAIVPSDKEKEDYAIEIITVR